MSKLPTLLQDLCAYPKLDSQADEEALLLGLAPQVSALAAHLASLEGEPFERACLQVYLALKQPSSPFSHADRGAWFINLPIKGALLQALVRAPKSSKGKVDIAMDILTGAFIHADVLPHLVCAATTADPEATQPIYAALDMESLRMSSKAPPAAPKSPRKRAV